MSNLYNYIVAGGRQDSENIFWTSYSALGKEYSGFDLYSGNSGVLYYLISRYENSKNPKDLELIFKSSHWIIENYDFSLPPSFITGELGIAYALSIVPANSSNINKIRNFIDKIIKSSLKKLISYSQLECAEYLNGLCGSLMALYLLRDYIENYKKVLEKIIFKLNAYKIFTREGIHWDYSSDLIAPLNGLTHGKSGIAYCLFFIGSILKNKKIIETSYLTFESEKSNKSDEWFDFRFDFTNINSMSRNLMNYKIHNCVEVPFMNAWCHGGIGIDLARNIVNRALGDDFIKTTTIKTLIQIDRDLKFRNNPTICHGLASELLFVKKIIHFDNENLNLNVIQKNIQDKILELLEAKEYKISGFPLLNNVNDYSLFNGLCGVAYALEKDYSKASKLNIVLPEIELSVNEVKNAIAIYKKGRVVKKTRAISFRKKIFDHIFISKLNSELITDAIKKNNLDFEICVNHKLINQQQCKFIIVNGGKIKSRKLTSGEMDLIDFVNDKSTIANVLLFLSENLNLERSSCFKILSYYLKRGFFKIHNHA